MPISRSLACMRAHRPVAAKVLALVLAQLMGDRLQRLVAQLADGLFVLGQRVIDAHLVLAQVLLLAARRRGAELRRQLDQRYHRLRGLDVAVPVALHHVAQHVR